MSGVVIGVDPGLTGALAALTSDGAYDRALDMPHADGKLIVSDVTDWLADMGWIEMVVIEDVHSMKGQGIASTFKFGRAFGRIEGAVMAWQCPVTWVTPLRWKRRMKVTADKESSRARALELWPDKHADFVRVKDHNRAEAALIARWWIERDGS